MRSKKPKRAESPKIVKLPSDDDEIAEAVSAPRLSAQPAAKKIRQKYKDIRRKEALKLLKLRGAETDLADPNVTVSNKSAHIAA